MNACKFSITALVGLIVLTLAWPALAQPVDPLSAQPPARELRLSMADAIRLALEQNNQVRLQLERIEQARAQSLTQLGALLPAFSSSVSGNSQKFFLGQIGGRPVATDPFEIYDLRGNFTQNLFNWSLMQRWRASRDGVQAAHLDAETTKRDTAATVGLLYLEALRAEALHTASESNVRLDTELLMLAQNRQSAGMATALDTARAESQLEHERQRLFALKSEVDRTRLDLVRALGIKLEVQVVLTDTLRFFEPNPPTTETALATAMDHRAELKAQRQRVRLASLTFDSTTAERYPSLNVKGDVGLVGNRPDGSIETHNVGLVLSVPLFDGQREGRIQETRSQVSQEVIRLKDVTDQISLEVRQALATLAPARQQVTVAERGLAAAIREMELARERFVMLAASNIELTNAQASIARAKDNWVEALFRFNASRVNLARAQGRLEDLY